MQRSNLSEPRLLSRLPVISRVTDDTYLRDHGRQIFLILSSLYILGGILFGYIFLSKMQTVFQTHALDQNQAHNGTGLNDPVVLVTADQKTRDDLAIPKEKRVNILLLGIDQRVGERAMGYPSRTDTILLATLDLTNKTAGLLSVPRDLYVTIPDIRIPGQGSGPQIDRINTAHFWGDWLKYPGGGPELLKKTFSYNFGAQIDYYARIDFRGFERAVDALGGVTVNVEKPIYDAAYPTDDDETMTIYFAPGQQKLNGQRALQYVRTRHADSDFERSRRQQQVLVALAQQAMKVDALPKLPSLIGILGSSFASDIPVTEMLRLGTFAKEIDANDIVTRQIDPTMVTETITSGGADVLIPKKEKIELALQDVLYGPMVRREAAKIAVLSGVAKPDVAARLARSLQGYGYEIVTVGDADSKDYRQSQIVYHTVKPYTVMTLVKHLKTPASKPSIVRDVSEQPNTTTGMDKIDITIIVGQDIAHGDLD